MMLGHDSARMRGAVASFALASFGLGLTEAGNFPADVKVAGGLVPDFGISLASIY
jgi:hypothetical protein